MQRQNQRHSITNIAGTLLLAAGLGLGALQSTANAAPKTTNLQVVPVISSVVWNGSQLLASGTATAVIHGNTVTVPFNNVPVNVSLAANQAGADPACPILDLQLAPINLNLLGLQVTTSQICLDITAHQGGGLLGDLLCGVANLLNGGLTLNQALATLTTGQLNSLLGGITNLLNGALNQLLQAVVTQITQVNQGHTCAILHLELGPLNLTLLGLEVVLDNCANGPVTVDITAITGQGNLLGNLLCELLGGGLNGLSLQNILNLLTGLLTG